MLRRLPEVGEMIKCDVNDKYFLYPLLNENIGLVVKVFKNKENFFIVKVFINNDFYDYNFDLLCKYYVFV